MVGASRNRGHEPRESPACTHGHVSHLVPCCWASSLSCPCLRSTRLSPHPAPRRLPWTTGSPSGWASAPQTPPHSTPGPHCAGSSLHLSPCQEEKWCKDPFFHIMFQQMPSRSTSSPHPQPSTHAPCPQRCQGCPAQALLSCPRCFRPVVWVDLGPGAALSPTHSWVQGGAVVHTPTREGDQKQTGFAEGPWHCPRQNNCPKACTSLRYTPLGHTEGITASPMSHHLLRGAGGSGKEGRR